MTRQRLELGTTSRPGLVYPGSRIADTEADGDRVRYVTDDSLDQVAAHSEAPGIELTDVTADWFAAIVRQGEELVHIQVRGSDGGVIVQIAAFRIEQ